MKKGLTPQQVAIAKQVAQTKSNQPELDDVLLELSCSVGLTAHEMAQLTVRDVTDHRGRIKTRIEVRKAPDGGALRARSISVVASLAEVLRLHIRSNRIQAGPLFLDRAGNPMKPAEIRRRLGRIYDLCGFVGATAESGRAGFSRRLLEATSRDPDFSPRDAQVILGYAQLSYVLALQPPSDRMVRLIDLVWDNSADNVLEHPAPMDRAAPSTSADRELKSVSAIPANRTIHLTVVGHAAELQRQLTAMRKLSTRQSRTEAWD